MVRTISPSWKQGFYPSRGKPRYPGLHKGLISSWSPPLGPSGVTLHDVSGVVVDGTLTDMDPATSWVPSEIGYVVDFDGADDSILYPHHPTLNIAGANRSFSIGVWFKTTPIGGIATSALLQKGVDANSRSFQLFFNEQLDLFRFQMYDGVNNPRVDASESLTHYQDDVWHLAVAIRDVAASEMRLFINGIDVSTDADNVAFNVDFNDTGIMSYGDVRLGITDPFNGQAGPHFLYDRVLSGQEILILTRDPVALTRHRPLEAAVVSIVAAASGVTNSGSAGVATAVKLGL